MHTTTLPQGAHVPNERSKRTNIHSRLLLYGQDRPQRLQSLVQDVHGGPDVQVDPQRIEGRLSELYGECGAYHDSSDLSAEEVRFDE